MFKKLFKQTFIYGIATVLPRMLNFLLVPLYTTTTVMSDAQYGQVSVIFAYFVLFNVLLSYGMETAFFRFLHKQDNPKQVVSTSTWSLVGSSSLFLILGYLSRDVITHITDIPPDIIEFVLWILFFDALAVIPFAWLRAEERPIRYAVIKTINVALTIGLNLFFLLSLKDLAIEYPLFNKIYIPDFQVGYVFIANLIASLLTLVMMAPFYFKVEFKFDKILWKRMLNYAFPVLLAGIAFAVNEAFDRVMLRHMLPQDTALAEVGAYNACYKLALFMTLFSTAFRLGVEPFFFSHASSQNAQTTYAQITKYFSIFGALIYIVVIVFADLIKQVVITSDTYWYAMKIVPLVLLANLFLGIYYNLSVWYKVTDRTRYGGYISLIAAAVTIVVNLILIPTIGFMGAAISTLAAYGSMMILSYIWGQKYYRIPYDLKRIAGYLGLSILFSVISFYGFRGNYVVGIGLLLVFLVVIYKGEGRDLRRVIKR